MSDEGHGHDWFYPKRLGGLCCRNCGLWHGAWSGDACPGKLERWEFGPSGDYWSRIMATVEAIVRDLAASNPEHGEGWDGEYTVCAICEESTYPETGTRVAVEHTESCPWRRARELMEDETP